MRWESWSAAAGDLLLGAVCHGCGTPWWGVCPGCRERLRSRLPYVSTPHPRTGDMPVTVSCSPYDELISGLVTAHKDRAALGLARLLADRLAQSVHALLQSRPGVVGPVVLVPVPSAAAAVRRRGYDATWTLARLAARQLAGRHPVAAERLLRQRRGLADQSGLDAAARRRNVDNGLRLRAPVSAGRRAAGAQVVLVDDLVTTGASLAEAARALRAAGLPVVGAATVAATERHRPAAGG